MFKRVTSALMWFPLVLVILLIRNKFIVDICLAVISAVALKEYFDAVQKKAKPIRWIGYISCLCIAFIHVVPIEFLPVIVSIAIPTIMLLLFAQIIATDMEINFKDAVYTFFGIAYIVFFMMFIAFIDGMPDGKILIWYAIIAAWGTDIFALFTGKLIGKHKFSKVSPKKSIEGCIGGTIGAVLLVLLYTYAVNTIWQLNYSYLTMSFLTIPLSLIGQIGDFAASSIKRYVEIKDYSNLIPGHGGMLDRIDSLLFLAPFAYALFRLL